MYYLVPKLKNLIRYFITLTCFGLLLLSIQATAQKKKEGRGKVHANKRKRSNQPAATDYLYQAEQLIDKNPELALDRVEEALTSNIIQKDVFVVGKCYLLIGEINSRIETWDLAQLNYLKALEILEIDYLQTLEFIEAIDGMVKSSVHLGQYAKAIGYLDQKIELINDDAVIVNTLLDRADVQFQDEDFGGSMESVLTADSIIALKQLKSLIPRSSAAKAILLAREDDVTGAENLYLESQNKTILQNGDFGEIIGSNTLKTSKEELINAYSRSNRTDDVIKLRNQSISNNELEGNALEVVKEKQALSEVLIDNGNTNAAIVELNEAVLLADSLNNLDELANSYLSLAEIYDQQGDSRKSINYYKQFSDAIIEKLELASESKRKKDIIVRKQQDLNSLSKDIALDNTTLKLEETSTKLQLNIVKLQSFVIYGLIGLLLITIFAAWFIYRNAKRSKVRGQMLALKSLRGQMNPHFIFNSLNSVNHFIALNDEKSANKFLSQFSKLMRLVLDSSLQDFISLQEEKEIVMLYLKLEHNRFRDKFDYELNIPENLSLESIEIPPMLIQPYIENAIWHGLRYKEEKGYLTVDFSIVEKILRIKVMDNGIGRKKSRELKTNRQKEQFSTGMKNTEERINIINRIYKKNYRLIVSDMYHGGSGTQVIIELPIEKMNEDG